jgi:hypothetical protein
MQMRRTKSNVPTLQTLVDWANIGVVIALAASFVVGGASIFLSRRLGNQKDAQYLREKQASDERIALAGESAARADARAATANEGVAKSKEEIARLTLEAEEAKTERAEADKQIAIAKVDAAKAKEGTANAEAQAAKASVEVAKLQVIVANAEKERAQAEKDLLELQERIRPRRLTSEQKAGLIELLKNEPKGPVIMECLMAEPETCNFAMELRVALEAAGFKIEQLKMSGTGPVAPTGINVLIPGQPVPAHANFLMHALREIGLHPVGIVDPIVPKGAVFVRVGIKP